jgi:predicted Rossmann fold nucleotide-binding protein DprA/Smf involved in DNA uptake
VRSVIIAGSRTVSPTVEQITEAIAQLGDLLWVPADWEEIVSGTAPGADRAGEAWAKATGKALHKEPITDELVKQYGKYLAPKMRNRLMAERADACVVFWDGTSSGTADMVCRMVARGKPVAVVPWAKAKGVRRAGR